MREITEIVDLPDAAVQPLVHPLDLRDARQPFRRSQLIGMLASPAVGVCVAALIWFVSSGYVGPLVAGCAIVGFGALAGHLAREQAWAYIPRKRQDRRRALPLAWELGSALVLGVVLAVALILVVVRLARPDLTPDVREYTFGMGVAVGLLLAGDVVVTLVRGGGRRALRTTAGLLAVAACLVAAYVTLFDTAGSATSSTVVAGIVSMLVVGAGVGVWKYVEYRRRAVAR
ncbi:MAG: hypothetical protein GEV10_02680 [Streptosporangiales bacterium]|nr:hypothetical protein [Streptosporangiales bacterium]